MGKIVCDVMISFIYISIVCGYRIVSSARSIPFLSANLKYDKLPTSSHTYRTADPHYTVNNTVSYPGAAVLLVAVAASAIGTVHAASASGL